MNPLEPIRIAILAGNKREAEIFIKNYAFKDSGDKLIYIDTERKSFGIQFDDFMVVGTFWQREDSSELYETVKSRIR